MPTPKEVVKLLKAYYGKKDAPFIANWIITSQCNCRCPFCELGIENKYNPIEELTTEEAFRLIKELKEVGISYLTLCGGEVFMRRDIWDILKELHKEGFKVGIVTNGLMLPGFSEEKIALLKEYVNTLVISLDSSIPEEHNEFRKTPGLFENIIKGINKLQVNGYTNITFESIVMGKNYKQIPKIIELSHKLKIRKVMFRPINIASNFPSVSAVSNKNEFAEYNVDEIIKYIDIGIKRAKELHVDTDLFFNRKWIIEYFRNLLVNDGFFHDRVMSNYFCFIPFNYVIINYNGGLLPCLLLKEEGNVKSNSLKVERTKSDHIRKQLSKREFFPICNCCFCQANNNVRFSTLCSPIRNIGGMGKLVKDLNSVRKRFGE